MQNRRSILSAAITLIGTTTASLADTNGGGTSQTSQSAGKWTVPGDLLRFGLIPNNAAAAAANTAALKSLVDPAGTFRGNLWFPNTTGEDTYYFNDIIPFHDGVRLDLQGCVLHFSKTGVRGDTNSGFIFAVRDFSITNGSIVVDYQMGGGGTNAGNALTFGNRGQDSLYFSPTFDSQLKLPMGGIEIRNLRITSNTKGGNGIFMIGGLNGVMMENVWIDGSGALDGGIYYEFGWATGEPRMELRQTSHAHNMRFSNINISNMNAQHGWAFTLNGAYNCWVDGLYVKQSKVLFACGPGESGFYRPWIGVDQVGAKRNIALRNVVGVGITGTAIDNGGASSKAGGYLHVTQNNASEQTDLIDFSIDGFAIDGGNLDGGYGIHSSAEKVDLRNGRITNFSRGVVTTHECTRMTIDSVDIFGCRQSGMEIGQNASIWNPARAKMGTIRNCFIAGNSVAAPGTFAAIELDVCAAFVIECNRFGYESAHDGIAETTQGASVRIGARANNVVCRCNHTGGIRDTGTAYVSRSPDASKGNSIDHASGTVSATGGWSSLIH
jgi:hypothetical protein